MEERSPSGFRDRQIVLVSIVIGLSFFLSVVVFALTFYRVRVRPDTLTATGSMKQRIASDLAKWNASFSRRTVARNLADANTSMERDLKVVLDYLKRSGMDEKRVTLVPMTVTQEYEQVRVGQEVQMRPTEFTLRQTVLAESNDIGKVTEMAQNISGLMNQGLFISTGSLEYYYTKLPELRVELLKGAIQDARERARTIVENGGSQLGKLKSVSAGVIQVLPPESTNISDYGAYDTSTIEKDAMATVRATFEIR